MEAGHVGSSQKMKNIQESENNFVGDRAAIPVKAGISSLIYGENLVNVMMTKPPKQQFVAESNSFLINFVGP